MKNTRFPIKRFSIVLGIAIISLGCLAIFKNSIIKSVVAQAASRITGAPVKMDSFSLNIFSSTINISGLKMFNPEGFPEGVVVYCPVIKVIYDRSTLFKRKLHLLLVEIELKEMGLTKNEKGRLNVDELMIVKEAKFAPPTPMQIDLLTLSIGRIVYKDYTAGAEPIVRVRDVNRHKSYKGVPTTQQLALLVLAEPMKAAVIKNAQIYGVAMFAGVAVLPVVIAATIIGKDYVRQTVDSGLERVYETSLQVVRRMGLITKDDIQDGAIKAHIYGANVALQFRRKTGSKTEITISARKYMLPKLDLAGGVLYQVIDKLQ